MNPVDTELKSNNNESVSTFKNQRGVIPLAILAVGFLVVSLASLTAATNNPLKKYLIDTLAGKNNQYSQGGKWNIKEGCKGSGCVVGPDVKPGGYAITSTTTDLIPPTTKDLTKACEADKAAGVGNYICDTPGGLQEYSITSTSHKYQDIVKSCDADKATGVANYICNTAGGLQEYIMNDPNHKYSIEQLQQVVNDLQKPPPEPQSIPGLSKDDMVKLYNFLNTGSASSQDITQICQKVSTNCTSQDLGQFAADQLKKSSDFNTTTLLDSYNQRKQEAETAARQPKTIPGLTYEEIVKLYNFLNTGTASKADVLLICQKISKDCGTKDLGQFAADELKKSSDFNATTLLNTYNQREQKLEAPPRQPTVIPTLSNDDVVKLYNFLNTGTTPDKDVLKVCQKISKDCGTKDLGQFAADQLKQAPEFNSQALLNFYNERKKILEQPAAQPNPDQPTQANPEAGNYSQLDFTNITLPNGKTVAAAGCGLIALTNILNTAGGYNYTPEQVLIMIKPGDWQPDGLISLTDGPIYKILTNAPKYNPDIGTNFNFKWTDYRASAYNLYGRMNAESDVLLIGSDWVYGTKSDGGYVKHITYLIKGDEPGTFELEKNDYFGSDMICKPGKTNRGDGFNCSNDKGEEVSIPTNNQTTYIYTAPGQ